LQGTLFKLPGVWAVARQRLYGEPEGSRIAVVEGDFFKDSLPDGHDAMIVAKHLAAVKVRGGARKEENISIGVSLRLR
jgi:hypothetical protein